MASVKRGRLSIAPGWLLMGIALGLVAATLVHYFQRGFVPGDATVYLAAGERLNAGHLLYALSPGDRPVEMQPPHWTVPLLSPPLIAVVFRPLALLPPDLGAYVWWFGTMTAIVASVGMMAWRRPGLTGVALLLLDFPIVYEFAVGNVNGLLLIMSIGAWWFGTRGREEVAGGLIGVMAGLKITPAMLALWLLFLPRPRRALAGLAASVVACLAVGAIGAGIGPHFEYLDIMRQTSSIGTSDLSLAGMARFVGVPADVARWLPWLAIVVCSAVAVAWRRRIGVAYVAVIAAWVLGSPVVNINTFTLLIAWLAPAAFPSLPLRRPGRDAPPVEVEPHGRAPEPESPSPAPARA